MHWFNFMPRVYKLDESSNDLNKYVLIINCSHGKGNIKFIRENLKYVISALLYLGGSVDFILSVMIYF